MNVRNEKGPRNRGGLFNFNAGSNQPRCATLSGKSLPNTRW